MNWYAKLDITCVTRNKSIALTNNFIGQILKDKYQSELRSIHFLCKFVTLFSLMIDRHMPNWLNATDTEYTVLSVLYNNRNSLWAKCY